MTATVEVTRGAGYTQLTIDDARRRNPLSRALLAELRASVEAHGTDEPTLIISGAGGAFSAGADLSELTGTPADVAVDDEVAATGRLLRDSDVLVVAAVEGPCVGAAVDLALNADMIIAGSSAFFEIPAVRLGLLYNPEAVARWHRSLPRPLLSRLLLAGDRVGAEPARHGGLVATVVPGGDAVGEARRIARGLAEAPRAALTAGKRMLRGLQDGRSDPGGWQDERLRLLSAPERAAALAARRHV